VKSILPYAIFTVITCIFIVGFIIFSQWINTRAVESEQTITEATQTFLDTVTDRGALTRRDFDMLMANLGATGGTFDVTVIVERMFAIPNTSPLSPLYDPSAVVPSDFVRDYRHIHGFSTRDGSFASLTEPLMLRRHDLVSLQIRQTSFMDHQLNMTRQQNMPQFMREWYFARGVRNSGNLMIENESPPICFDGLTC
jgi:hypothetical protein